MQQSKRAPTLKDVAERVGVSQVTVSTVLNETRSNTRVSPATRQRIHEAVAELRYRPNAIARALSRRRTDIIGLYLGDRSLDTHGRFVAEIVGGLQHGCCQHHKDLLIHGTFRGQSVDDIYANLLDGRIDGLALFVELGDPLIARLAASSLPVIAIADVAPGLPSVVVEDGAGSSLLAQYLAAKGHRRVLYRKGPARQASAQRRQAAFQESACACGIEALEDTPLHCSVTDEFTAQEQAWLDAPAPHRPSAIVCWSDALADSTIGHCRRRGLRVPEDIAVAGFDGLTPDFQPALRLTTIRAPWRDVARTAVDLLVRRLQGEEAPQETVLPVDLVVGDTA